MRKRIYVLGTLIFLLWLSGCQQSGTEAEPTPEPMKTETPPLVVETAVSTSTTQDVSSTATMKPVTPNRDIYRTGLTSAAQDSLETLPNATVYEIAIAVDSEHGLVTGSQTVTYTNDEVVPLTEIYFHLLPNLLTGQIDVSQVLVNGQAVEPVLEEDFDSVMRLPLPTPLAPEETAAIAMNFVTAVPQELERNYGIFAQVDDIMALSHFYPMVAVYDGTGWNTSPASEQGDPTYSDAAFFHVTVTTGDEQVVAGSGVTLSESAANGQQILELAVGPARDFYLAISPRFSVVSRTVGETTINSYAPTELLDGAEDAAAFAANALRVYNERFEPYPYTELDIVGTPTLALGIEYPGIIALTLREYDPNEPLHEGVPNQVYMETTTAHEVGHQWFYNLVGNDQLDEPWLDESVTQYVTYLYYLDLYGQNAANQYKETWNGRFDRVENEPIPIGLPVSAYEGAEYSGVIYGRGPLFIEALAQEMGQETFDAFLADYVSQNQWGITTTESFRQLAEKHCACDLSDLFEEWVYE